MDSRGGRGDDDPQDESLSELLRSWRSRSDPRALPGLTGPGRRSVGLSQRDVARLAGVSERWYRSLERGEEANYSADFLDRLSSALQLSRAERYALYLRAIGRPPALAAVPETDAAAEMDEILQQFLDSQSPNPAYVSDMAWNVIGYNEPLREWFPWAAHQANLMRWAFLSREAREQLVNWREDWARPYLGQIRYARVHYPNNEALRRLERDILAGSPGVQGMWDRREVYEHVDGSLRRLKLPYHRGREVPVRIIALRPIRSDRLRVIVLMESGRGATSG
ncbi:helix-turn-helix domain-containing protein [Streptomyces sp. WI04-05B]|uniref:helix-turn-helix domain-containing protein n=1 Tax=Streptomyces TaxID=1883 RepID=UPI0029B74B68|nr:MULTISPECIES: helix-turn-helix domain-containing protein [unclassified Streptomyces]MDX2544622.1 helix-turn-helix domain-containing protein [Streptomyces sp. WI04-05B]MDX2588852.1 helix-turn-helix domain-containing protein [Streptomyces sp. WI04-05A]